MLTGLCDGCFGPPLQTLAQIEAEQQAEQEAAAAKAAAKKQAASAAKPAGLGSEDKARLKVGKGRAALCSAMSGECNGTIQFEHPAGCKWMAWPPAVHAAAPRRVHKACQLASSLCRRRKKRRRTGPGRRRRRRRSARRWALCRQGLAWAGLAQLTELLQRGSPVADDQWAFEANLSLLCCLYGAVCRQKRKRRGSEQGRRRRRRRRSSG